VSFPWSELISAVSASGVAIAVTWLKMRADRARAEADAPPAGERAALDESWGAYRQLRVHLDQRFAEVTAENRELRGEIAKLRKEVARLGRLEEENEDLHRQVRDLEQLLSEATGELRRQARPDIKA
jgi:predicted RNase H-like nuclease (RuvC/YqgF family)